MGGASGLIEKTGEVIDKFITTSEEKEELKQDLFKTIADYEIQTQSELTERLRIDMSSDSWLSKNIRPMTLIFTTVLVTWLSFTDGNIGNFAVKPSYVSLIENLMILQYTFYFGSRGIEKIMETMGKYNIGRKKKWQT